MKLTTSKKWLRTIAWLRRNFPAQHIICVRSKPMKKYQGTTRYSGKRFCIEINRKQCFLLRIDTLIHEWAHALTWFGAETHIDDHSSEWGLAYARIYRAYIAWNFGWEGSMDD